ncbi:MAG TPA: helix-turn-helix transcriptional regulator [Iamia sp.]|jgi:DNA-binding CsgD family transcriptional regulator|nr:helix-turn-helix transcriptional regulator [Iamia sp.]
MGEGEGEPTAAWWFDRFRASLTAIEHMRFGQVVVDAGTGEIVVCNPRARELLGGWVPDHVQDLVPAGVLGRPAYDELAAHAAAGRDGWRSEVTLHLPPGPSEITVIAATVDQPRLGARAIVALVCPRGEERVFIDSVLPDAAPMQLQFTYDEHLRIRGIDPRMGVYWDDPTKELGALIWVCIHPADIHLVVPWTERLVTGELDRIEYTVRVITHLGNWTPAHFELRRLLSDGDAPIAVTLTLVGEFKDTIAAGQLTPRERAVVAALFDGHRVPQIAARDDVSVKTLRNQLTAVYRKLGVADQGELLGSYHRPVDVPHPVPDLRSWVPPASRLA